MSKIKKFITAANFSIVILFSKYIKKIIPC